MATHLAQRRSGLPRVSGGDPWPLDGMLAAEAIAAPAVNEAAVAAAIAPEPQPIETPAAESSPAASSLTPAVRRGLPRVRGGEPWPTPAVHAGAAPAVSAAVTAATAQEPPAAAPLAAETAAQPQESARVAEQEVQAQLKSEAPEPAALTSVAQPTLSVQAPVVPAPVAAPEPAPQATKPETVRPPTTKPVAATTATVKTAPVTTDAPGAGGGLARRIVLWLLGLVAAAGIIVLAARGLTTLPGVPEFIERYPGEYPLPEFVQDGFPAWARWTHFLNFFFMVLIIRSGMLVRQQQKPPAFYTPKRGGKKVSIYLWMHTSLDVLWLVNGLVFVVLLFVSGHWARIVPTSWEVFPNALSSMLQYLTLEWPAENGWVNYNSLQQLMYFLIVFVAAPLAAITGVRMSEWWPERAKGLSKAFPAPVARAVHFPVMLFFVAFILVHVFLVVSTGMRKNLNHMFAGTDVTSWFGFWMLVIGLAVTAGAWLAARPLLLAPLASVSGKVSER